MIDHMNEARENAKSIIGHGKSFITIDDVIKEVKALSKIKDKKERQMHAAIIMGWIFEANYTNGFGANVGEDPTNEKLMNQCVAIFLFRNENIPDGLSNWLLAEMGDKAQKHVINSAKEQFQALKKMQDDFLKFNPNFHIGRFGHTIIPRTPINHRIKHFVQEGALEKYEIHGNHFHESGYWICYGGVPKENNVFKGFYHLLRDPYFEGFYPAFAVKKCDTKDQVISEGFRIGHEAEAEDYFAPTQRGDTWHCSYWCPEQEKMLHLISKRKPGHILGMRVDTLSGQTLFDMYKTILSSAKDKIRLQDLVYAAAALPINQ